DSNIGDNVNVGAGVITANFDGKNKRPTRVGKNVFLGSNTVLVAPVHVPTCVKTGAGAVVTRKTRIRKNDIVVGVPAKSVSQKKRR
ncbi:MAG TPA: DapH/DapD/GlmU-related protein, partial [Candidatus Omnitrophota bacterium]|nr:DapH/DapD/GlmU-related protein [Candidatus Omnitrophota bacterium]